MALEARDLSVTYRDAAGGEVSALSLAHLCVPAGNFLAVTGPSGSGKSTLLCALAGLIDLSGSVRWGEIELARIDTGARAAWRLAHVGFIFQDFHLVEELSPLANVLLPTSFRAMRPSSAERARARALLDRFGVPSARQSVVMLSRGERQRVAIARALLFDPPVILADEPTASLDATAAETIGKALVELAAEGRTVIAVTHDAALVARAGRELRLEHGQAAGRAA